MIPLMASINDSIASIFLVGILAVVIGYLLKRLHQPYLIGYIIIGVCLGQYGFDVFRNEAQIQFLGEIGVLSILLTQDIAIAPILIITALLGGQSQSTTEISLQILGAVIIVFTFLFLYKKEEIQFSWLDSLEKDHEMQVFMAIVFCAAGALLMGVLGLSPALGALCFTAYQSNIITEYGYNIGICLISLTLLCSPMWIICMERVSGSFSINKSLKSR